MFMYVFYRGSDTNLKEILGSKLGGEDRERIESYFVNSKMKAVYIGTTCADTAVLSRSSYKTEKKIFNMSK